MEYITTPIYYVNGLPHIGSSYTSIAADVIARYHRLMGKYVIFLTGTDEHGMKVAQSAEEKGIEPIEFCDQVSEKFRELSTIWNLSNDDFIRTTDKRHIKSAQALWNAIGHDLYKSKYAGWYDVRDEAFVEEKDVKDGVGPSGGRVEWMEEESFFFKLSAYQDRLLQYYEEHPDFIAPEKRKNEVVSFVKRGLSDLCVSRTRFSWGVPVPGEETHVMYVWIDALANYLSALGYPNMDKVESVYPNCVHLVGKEILRFHAVYWPAFLMSAGLPLPKRIFAHGWLTSEGQKMSKSIGNVVYPKEITEEFPVDSIRYYLFREIKFGEDGDFSKSHVKERINSELANEFGNLVQRVLSFIVKDGEFKPTYELSQSNQTLVESSRSLLNSVYEKICLQDLSGALNDICMLTKQANKFVEDNKPWSLRKLDDKGLYIECMTVLLELIKNISILLFPFMPATSSNVLRYFGIENPNVQNVMANVGCMKIEKVEPLFPKE